MNQFQVFSFLSFLDWTEKPSENLRVAARNAAGAGRRARTRSVMLHGSVIPCTTGYMGLDIMGCRPCGFVLATMSGGYRREARDGEKNRKYSETQTGQEGVLPPRD